MAKGKQNQLQGAGCPSVGEGQEVEYAAGLGRHGRPEAAVRTVAETGHRKRTPTLAFAGPENGSTEDVCAIAAFAPMGEDVAPDVVYAAGGPEVAREMSSPEPKPVDELELADDPVRFYLRQIGRVDLLTASEEKALARSKELKDYINAIRQEYLARWERPSSAVDVIKQLIK